MYVHFGVSVVIFGTWIAAESDISMPIAVALPPFFYTNEKFNYSEAESYCGSRNSLLLTLESRSKYDYFLAKDESVYTDYSNKRQLFIGLTTSSTNCTNYIWSSGQPMSWSYWDIFTFEPSQCSQNKCVKIVNRRFRTEPCNSTMEAICEYVDSPQPSPPPPSSSSSTTMKTTTNTNSTAVTSGGETRTMKATTNETMITEVTTTTAMSMATGSSTGPTSVNTSCGCCTSRQTNVTQLSQTELVEVITQLKAELSVSKNNTSTHQRKLISVYESRPSSMVMGGVACTIMSVMIGWIVVPDFITFCLFLFKCRNKNVVTPSV